MSERDFTESFAEQTLNKRQRFTAMFAQAKEKRLNESPPFGDKACMYAWQAGYETALRDIANRDIDAE